MSTIYRQRFTTTGYCGAFLLVLCPIIAAIILANFINALSSRYSTPDPTGYFIGLALFFAGSLLGALMVLIGREMYPYFPAIDRQVVFSEEKANVKYSVEEVVQENILIDEDLPMDELVRRSEALRGQERL